MPFKFGVLKQNLFHTTWSDFSKDFMYSAFFKTCLTQFSIYDNWLKQKTDSGKKWPLLAMVHIDNYREFWQIGLSPFEWEKGVYRSIF